MRVVNSKFKSTKIIPAKFKEVAVGYEFENDKVRLTSKERRDLIVLLVRRMFRISAPLTPQDKFAKDVVSAAKEIKIVKAKKRGGNIDWRIMADGIQIRVSFDMVGDCPKEFLEIMYEF